MRTDSSASGIRSAGNVIKGRSNLGRQRLIFDGERRAQLASGTSAEQRSGDTWSVAYPEQGDLRRGEVQSFRCSGYRLNDATAARFQIGLDEPSEVVGRRPRPARRAIPVLPSQHTTAQR